MYNKFMKIRRVPEEQFDGSRWEIIDTPNSIIFLTSQGRERLALGGVSKALGLYAKDAEESTTRLDDSLWNPETRIHLATGANAIVYFVGNTDLVIKEQKEESDDLIGGLRRMDKLSYAIEKHSPRWIDIPRHYGIMVQKNPWLQLLLMERIDAGVSVGDIINFPKGIEAARTPELYRAVDKNFDPKNNPTLFGEVIGRFNKIKVIIRKALAAEGLCPDTYIPDLDNNPHNVMVEALETPVAGSDKKFWIIDQ
jgi:hypothetical protein